MGCLALRDMNDPLCRYFGDPASLSVTSWSLLPAPHGYCDCLCVGLISLSSPALLAVRHF